jgi:hypothetical protein
MLLVFRFIQQLESTSQTTGDRYLLVVHHRSQLGNMFSSLSKITIAVFLLSSLPSLVVAATCPFTHVSLSTPTFYKRWLGSQGVPHLTKRGKTVVLTDKAPAPLPAFSQGVIHGNLIYVSGTTGVDPQTGLYIEGSVGNRTVSGPGPCCSNLLIDPLTDDTRHKHFVTLKQFSVRAAVVWQTH